MSEKIVQFNEKIIKGQLKELVRRRESSLEEALIEMYLEGVSVRRVEVITEALGAAEGMKEDKVSWVHFFQRLKGRGSGRTM